RSAQQSAGDRGLPRKGRGGLMAALLELDGVRAGYGPIDVLHGISLAVPQGEIVTIIGANGAGKTTTLHTISGLVRAREGKIIFAGRPIEKLRPYEIVR